MKMYSASHTIIKCLQYITRFFKFVKENNQSLYQQNINEYKNK